MSEKKGFISKLMEKLDKKMEKKSKEECSCCKDSKEKEC